MRMMTTLGSIALLSLAVGFGVFSGTAISTGQTPPAAPAKAGSRAVAVLLPTKGNAISGTIWFDTTPEGVHVHGTVDGLAPKSSHGFHIHEFGDQTSDDGMAAGGHFNPEGHPHGGPGPMPHHAGDMGNVTADDTGKATVDLTLPDVSISEGKNPIVGHGVVVHANVDNMTPTANPGARIAVGVIGYAKPQ